VPSRHSPHTGVGARATTPLVVVVVADSLGDLHPLETDDALGWTP
jgi:hypothetical protein